MELEMDVVEKVKADVDVGEEMHDLIAQLYPICRSITGNGVRETLRIIKKLIPIDIHEISSGLGVFDWEVPREWNIAGAYIKNASGETIVDFADSNLHVLNYSVPVHTVLSLRELKHHLYSLPEHPDWIPYRTSYYKEDWGFCMAHNQLLQLKEGDYEVYIDSSLKYGHLTYAELYIEGNRQDEVLISTHICHPSLCNDNLSGISVATFLAKELLKRKPRYSYRFLFIPGTIGAIAWLSINEARTKNIKHGLIASLLGCEGDFVYKKSRQGHAEIDQIVEATLANAKVGFKIMDFEPTGYDERQFCSPGFNLPVGLLARARPNQFPEYHTSADNLEFVKPEALEGSLSIYKDVIDTLEANHKYFNLNPKCEPNLGKRGLYNLVGNSSDGKEYQNALLWVLNFSDGAHTLLDIYKKSGIRIGILRDAAQKLMEKKLLVKL